MKARLPLQMSKKQKQILNDEVKRVILEEDKKFAMESDANVLFTLYNDFGFGKERLLKFWRIVKSNHEDLMERYEMSSNEDMGWLYMRLLKERTGIDIEELYKGVEGCENTNDD